MAKLTLNTIGSRYGSIDALNDNFDAIEQAIENTFSLDGTSPNALETDLDMNSNDILNIGEIDVSSLRINGTLVQPGTLVSSGAAFQNYFFTATAGQTSFSVAPSIPYVASLVVVVNGLQLSPNEISVSGTNVILPPLSLGDEVAIRRYTADVTTVVPPTPEISSFQSYSYTATAGQTTFSVSPATPYAASLVVVVNGLQLSPSEISVFGSDVFLPPLSLGDEVVIRRYTTDVTTVVLSGIVETSSGGTGQISYTNGQLLIGNSTGNTLTKSTLTAGSNISITNGSGSITIASTAGVTLNVVTTTTQLAVANNHYVLTNVALSTVTLPATPTAGDTVWVTPGNGLTTNVVARNGSNIMSLAEDLTIDNANATVQLRFINSTLGWRFV